MRTGFAPHHPIERFSLVFASRTRALLWGNVPRVGEEPEGRKIIAHGAEPWVAGGRCSQAPERGERRTAARVLPPRSGAEAGTLLSQCSRTGLLSCALRAGPNEHRRGPGGHLLQHRQREVVLRDEEAPLRDALRGELLQLLHQLPGGAAAGQRVFEGARPAPVYARLHAV